MAAAALFGVLLSYAAQAQQLTGVNIAGGEFGKELPGVHNHDYRYPDRSDIEWVAAQGFNAARVPFKWERIQPQLFQSLHQADIEHLDAVVRAGASAKVRIILDLHSYGGYRGAKVGSAEVPDAALADVWRRLARRYRHDPHVIFGLMNEPHGIPAEKWRRSAEIAVAAIREAGADNLILVPGTRWSGAHSWTKPPHDSNAAAFAGFRDPARNFWFEMHQYLDDASSGTSTHCSSADVGARRLEAATEWLRQTGGKALLGEFGASQEPTCIEALEGVLSFMRRNRDVWAGWTYWAAGPWWGDYYFSVHPDGDGSDKPQMRLLKHYAALAHCAESPQ